MPDNDRSERMPSGSDTEMPTNDRWIFLRQSAGQPSHTPLRLEDVARVRDLALIAAQHHLNAGRPIPAHVQAALTGTEGVPSDTVTLLQAIKGRPRRPRRQLIAIAASIAAVCASGFWVFPRATSGPPKVSPTATGLAVPTAAAAAADRAQTVYDNAVAMMDAGTYEQAVVGFTAALGLRPDWVDAYYNRAVSYQHLEKFQEAIRDFSEVIHRKPRPQAYYNRAMCYMNVQQLKEAETDLTVYIEQARNAPAKAYTNRAKVRARLGDQAGAKSDREAAQKRLDRK